MLDIKTHGNAVRMEIRGSTEEIMADVCMVINNIYSSMYKQNKPLANVFRKGITRVIVDPDSPMWDPNASRGIGFMVSTPIKSEEERC